MKKELTDFKGKKISSKIDENNKLFKEILKYNQLTRYRDIVLKNTEKTRCSLVFLDGMVNSSTINESVIKPLLQYNLYEENEITEKYITENVLYACEIVSTDNIGQILNSITYGDTVLFIDGSNNCLIIDTKGWDTRGVTEPQDEKVLQGPREGFCESVIQNLSLLNRKFPSPDFCAEMITVGKKTATKIFVCYIDSVVNKKTVDTIKNRISEIDIDGILDSNYINELINKHRFSLFKTVGSTERPDIVAAKLLEGRVAILVDGTPVVLTAPYLFVENLQSDDDYYQNYLVGSFGRVLRFICFYIAIFLPALFIALTVFNPQLLPLSFFSSVAVSRGGIPFSTFSESLALILIFEILKETGVRMHESVGHALSIVGGLVIGQAAVEAKIISAPILIITALSGIASLMIPRLKGAVIYFKLLLLVLSSLLGLLGFFAGFVLMHIHIYSLDSFGVSYTNIGSVHPENSLKDSLIRVRWTSMIKRPDMLTLNLIRQKRNKTDD